MNTDQLANAIARLELIASARLRVHFNGPQGDAPVPETYPLDLGKVSLLADHSPLSSQEQTLILLTLVPHLRPDLLGRTITQHLPEGGDLPEFGGVRGENHRGVLPTGETAQFILAGDDLEARLEVQRMLSPEHWFAKRHVLWLEPVREGEPRMSGRLILDPEIVEQLTTGTVSLPRFGSGFPAEHVETALEWDDIVLHPDTLRGIREIEHWIWFNDTVIGEWGMGARVKPGYRALFHGPPGTGKTLTATLLGKATGRPVFRIDLSRVVSKYIGETEKNLAGLFDKAENKDWILFFDEADALFGKRTEIRDAHDKYANQEVAYLLQRIENFAGLVILATNRRANLDEAFLRRFQAAVSFPMPDARERHDLWLRTFPAQVAFADDVDWRQIASRFELTGAGIVNVAHFCAVEALAGGVPRVDRAFLEAAIIRELVKEGKLV